MNKKVWIIIAIIALMLVITGTAVAFAQDSGGAILGTVYNDLDANGVCVGTGEPGLPGMVVSFSNVEAAIQTAIQTNENGSYGYTSAGFGTWNITVKPPQGWRTTAEPTRQVILTSSQPVASGIDFCITQDSSTPVPTSTSTPESGGSTGSEGAVTLPESGAPIAPSLLIAAAIGIGLLAIGAGLYFYSRRASA